MGLLDSLVAEGHPPKPGMEYIYMFNMVFPKDKLESIEVPYGSIVIDVEATQNSFGKHTGYDFKLKGMDEVFHCNYPWAFAEHTEENILKIEAYDKLCQQCDELEEKRQKHFATIDNLLIK